MLEPLKLATGMRIAFITNHQIGRHPSTGKLTAAGASGRLRAILPAQALVDRGFDVTILSLHHSSEAARQPLDPNYDIYIASKLFDNAAIDKIEVLVQLGKIVVFDFCDNYFERSALNEFYDEHQRLLRLATYATVNTFEMGKLLRSLKPQLHLTVIPDCYEGSIRQTRLPRKGGVLRLLAFGNRLVCKHLSAWLPALATFSEACPLSIEVLTQVDLEILQWLETERKTLTENFDLTITNWTEYQLDNALRRNDIVLIPSEDGAFYRTKSANRLIEAIVAGLPVVAFPVESYLEFIDDVPLTRNPTDGLRLCLDNQDLIERGLARAREKILLRYSHQRIGRLWEDQLYSVLYNQQTELDSKSRDLKPNQPNENLVWNDNISIVSIDDITAKGEINGYRRLANPQFMSRLRVSLNRQYSLILLSSNERHLPLIPNEFFTGAFEWVIGHLEDEHSTNRERISSLGLDAAWEAFVGVVSACGALTASEISELDKSRISIENPFCTVGPTDCILAMASHLRLVSMAFTEYEALNLSLTFPFDLIMKMFHQFILVKTIRPIIGTPKILFHEL